MSPLSLLFSSDEETSRRLSQVLKELELEVEPCPEIFAAVEKLTSRSFDVIVADWDEGLEGTFLLKTSRELKSNRSAFAIAIANPSASAAARQAGADLVLSKPIVPEQAKYALLTCDEFLSRMKGWLPRLGFQTAEDLPDDTVGNSSRSAPTHPKLVPEPLASHPLQAPRSAAPEGSFPAVPAFPFPENSLLRQSRIQTLFSSDLPRPISIRPKRRHHYRVFLHVAALGATFLSVGYVFSQPARSEAVAVSVAKICGRALEKTQAWLHTPEDDDEMAVTSQVAQSTQPNPQRSRGASAKIRVTPVGASSLDETTPSTALQSPLQAEVRLPQPGTANGLLIPESLKVPVESTTVRNVAARLTPSLLSTLEPINIPADFAEKLLLRKVQPNYPAQALQAGLQGPVVLQAWIGRDGTIRDLKLIRGSLLLGQAAYRAVKQWRYKPYFLNGQAVETETYVTIDFRLP
jgi:TonB family protein